MRRNCVVAAVVMAFLGHLVAQQAWALATEKFGNEPLSELNYPEWKGIMPIVNDKARVYNVWVNGNEHMFYKGTAKELNTALANFAKIEMKEHLIVLRPGPGLRRSLDKKEIPYNWELHVIGGIAKSRATREKRDLYWFEDPVLTVHIDGDIDLEKLEIPKSVTVLDAPSDKDKEHEAIQKKIADFVKNRKENDQ